MASGWLLGMSAIMKCGNTTLNLNDMNAKTITQTKTNKKEKSEKS